MPDSLTGVLIAVALILPGFVIVQLSRAGRPTGEESELALVLRALFYALVLHLVAAPWTAEVDAKLASAAEWRDHIGAIVLYALVVLGAVPIAAGLALGRFLRTQEESGRVGQLYYVLGAHDARDAWDYIFQRLKAGSWVIVELTDDAGFVGGKYGGHSAVGQSPAPHDIYLEELYVVTGSSRDEMRFTGRVAPTRGIWVSSTEIRTIQIPNPPSGSVQSNANG